MNMKICFTINSICVIHRGRASKDFYANVLKITDMFCLLQVSMAFLIISTAPAHSVTILEPRIKVQIGDKNDYFPFLVFIFRITNQPN